MALFRVFPAVIATVYLVSPYRGHLSLRVIKRRERLYSGFLPAALPFDRAFSHFTRVRNERHVERYRASRKTIVVRYRCPRTWNVTGRIPANTIFFFFFFHFDSLNTTRPRICTIFTIAIVRTMISNCTLCLSIKVGSSNYRFLRNLSRKFRKFATSSISVN